MTPRRGRTILLALLAGWILPAPDLGAAENEPSATLHHVQRGETLSSIAAIYLGNPHLWPAVYRANRDQIRDPSRLYPGQTLSIPETAKTTVPDGAAREGAARRAERATR